MKWFVNALLVMFLVVGFSCSSNTGKKTSEQQNSSIKSNIETATVNLKVDGMTCSGCENTIQTKLSVINGVQSVEASHEKGEVLVMMDKSKMGDEGTSPLDLAKEIEASGYAVKAIEITKK